MLHTMTEIMTIHLRKWEENHEKKHLPKGRFCFRSGWHFQCYLLLQISALPIPTKTKTGPDARTAVVRICNIDIFWSNMDIYRNYGIRKRSCYTISDGIATVSDRTDLIEFRLRERHINYCEGPSRVDFGWLTITQINTPSTCWVVSNVTIGPH